ncbi:MAG: hypothetical protein RLY47_548 [Candidatus Parcubacteria bacterium]|jgi:glucose/arabinose dehydrogenase
MHKKLFHIGLIVGTIVLLFVLFPQVLVPQIDDLPKPPSAMAEFVRFDLPPGFTANVFASDLPGVRVLEEDPNGTIIASLTKEGRVVAVTDTDYDGEANEVVPLIDGLHNPHGLALLCESKNDRECSLYVAETEQISLYTYDPVARDAEFVKKVVDLPSMGDRITRTLLTDPSGENIFVSIGSSCEFCQELDRRYATIQLLDLKKEKMTTYANGLYNTVFMAIQPTTGLLWGTEMAPGDPSSAQHFPDEINILRKGKNYGWPFCYGDNLSLEDFQAEEESFFEQCNSSKIPSTLDLPPHSAPLGLAFIPSEGWPEEYKGDLLVTYHGPATAKLGDGHRVVRIKMNSKGMPIGTAEPFMTGFADEEGRIVGRPVALIARKDGTLLVSGDLSGVIYRVSWQGDR